MPNDAPDRNAPTPLDRSALERVLARAAELQGTAGDAPEEALSEAQLLEVGREVGIDAAYLRQALAEERTRVTLPADVGFAGKLAGPAGASASRVVAGQPAGLLETIDAWMQREECLQVKRRLAGRMTWEARRDLWGSGKRLLRVGGGYDLARAAEVSATLTPVDGARSLVRLDADLTPARTARLRAGAASAAGGAVAATAVGVAGAVAHAAVFALLPLAIIPAAAGVGVGGGVARGHRGTAARAQLALEQLLDRLEHGGARRTPSVLEIVGAVAKRLK